MARPREQQLAGGAVISGPAPVSEGNRPPPRRSRKFPAPIPSSFRPPSYPPRLRSS